MKTNNCETCEKQFNGYGKTCDSCRQKKSRMSQKTEESVTETVCHGCNEKQESNLVCICHLCIDKGVTHKSLGIECEGVGEKYWPFHYGEPNWKKKYETKEDAKSALMKLLVTKGGHFTFWGDYKFCPDPKACPCQDKIAAK